MAEISAATRPWKSLCYPRVKSLTVFSPAKINVFLAITGRRADGFHDLVSVAAPLTFGDQLSVELNQSGVYSLTCDVADVPVDASNLILRAAELFRARVPEARGAHFHLTKRVPMGAGLGGGSSNGTAALMALNTLHASVLDLRELVQLAAKLGSDCALFVHARPCVMRGRGEEISVLPSGAAARITGRRIFVFKPSFGIPTAWAYREMAAASPASYLPRAEAEAHLARWLDGPTRSLEELVANNMETVAFAKFVALPVLLKQVRQRFGVTVGMSGSGSACFALLPEDFEISPLLTAVCEAWGHTVFAVETRAG